MQDEEIDKLIKDAANQHHPPYYDTAWGKMETMLDKHLPQQKDRRKPLLFLLFFLLLGGAIITGTLQPWKSKTGITENIGGKQLINTKQEFGTAPQGKTNEVVNDNTITPPITNEQNGTSLDADTKNNTGKTTWGNKNAYKQRGKTSMKIKKPTAGTYADEEPPLFDIKTQKEISDKAKSQISEEQKQITVAAKTDTTNKAAQEKKESLIAKDKIPLSKEKKKTNNNFADNFALTFSTGAEISYIDINNTGKLKLFYGAGLSYIAGKHLKLSTGLLITQKVYSASPYQYKFSGGGSYPNLESINANCKVYEIPFTLYYNFKEVKNHNWFGGLGVSSLLMKKETYDYLYKTPSGQMYTYSKTINNENKHYFSVLTLSGGYQYKLNKRISLIAEPYLKLPLSGVGAGKIQLKSTGLLFTVAIKPFTKTKK